MLASTNIAYAQISKASKKVVRPTPNSLKKKAGRWMVLELSVQY